MIAVAVEGVTFPTIRALWNLNTNQAIIPIVDRTDTLVLLVIPNSSITAGSLRGNTIFIHKNPIFRAETLSPDIVPDFTPNARISDTIVPIPHCNCRTFARPRILIPHHSTITRLYHNAKLSIPLRSVSTHAFLFSLVP